MTKEPPLKQELGPKKYNKLVESTNKFYDKYKAGKRDPKTGEVYRNISYTNPNKKSIHSKNIGSIECLSCGRLLNITSATVSIICGGCGCNHSVTHNRADETFIVEAPNLEKE